MQNLELYVRLIWILSGVIVLLMGMMCFLFFAKNRARKREMQSRDFSILMIEGMETERRRVSRELHDTILPLVKDREISDLIRTICYELKPPDFSKVSLADSFRDLCFTFEKRHKMEVFCSIDDNIDFNIFSAENQLHLYRIVQEAFTNIGKHSGANKAVLTVHKDSARILICVYDDGKGLHTYTQKKESLGISSMRQRALLIGAQLDFVSVSGNGLMVKIETGNIE